MNLEMLLERCEGATKPSRQLDADLALALGIVKEERRPSGLRIETTARPYTASVDAALELIEAKIPGAYYRLIKLTPGMVADGRTFFATAGHAGAQEDAYHKIPALALCCALLKAISAEKGG